jgi:mono/diheme cytochrome c family protein
VAAVRAWIRGTSVIASAESEAAPEPSAEVPKEKFDTYAAEYVGVDTTLTSYVPRPPAPGGLSLDAQVLALFERRCSDCHKKRSPQLHGGVDLSAFRNSKYVDPARPAESILFKVVSRPPDDPDRMPQSEGRPGDKDYREPLAATEVELIRKWLAGDGVAGAPRTFIPLETVVKRIHDDLEAQPESLRPHLRYLVLTNLYNLRRPDGKALESDAQMETYRAGVSKLLNSISYAGRISVPQAIDAERTLLRIDLRDYQVAPELWEKIIGYYPYGIEGANARLENRIKQMTDSQRAYVRADWFVFATSQAPLYNEVLGLPPTEQELERKLGLSTIQDLRQLHAIRAAFYPSGVSETNRLIERHNLGASAGAYWKSYDFRRDRRTDLQDLKLAPLGPVDAGLTKEASRVFVHAGGEIIFHLPNGLQAYYLAKANGERLDRAPLDVVRDRSDFRTDGVILNGISCIACHGQGLNAPPGQTLDTLADEIGRRGNDLGSFQERQIIERLYPEPTELRRVAAEDTQRFQAALREATPRYTGKEDPVKQLYLAFRNDVVGQQVAAELWSDDLSLLKTLQESLDPTLNLIVRDVHDNLPIGRDQFLDHFEAMARALGFSLRPFAPLPYEEFGGFTAATATVRPAANRPERPEPAGGFVTTGAPERATLALPGGGKVTIAMSQLKYRVGQSLGFTISTDTDCYIKVVQFGADHSRTQLAPNALDPTDRLRAGERREFPGVSRDGKAIAFTTNPPIGAEALLLIASRTPLRAEDGSVDEGAFRGYQRASLLNSRGVVTIEAGTPIGQAHVGYLLIP